ncbi:peptide deformylase [uncultured Helicobacter sp.]|nr:peptide deformylase [uncultured Helicobacter sp.]
MTIIKYPDSRLKQKSSPVEVFDENLAQMLDEMYQIMTQTNGIGLAAIQVGIPLRALIINLHREDGEQYKEDTL